MTVEGFLRDATGSNIPGADNDTSWELSLPEPWFRYYGTHLLMQAAEDRTPPPDVGPSTFFFRHFRQGGDDGSRAARL